MVTKGMSEVKREYCKDGLSNNLPGTYVTGDRLGVLSMRSPPEVQDGAEHATCKLDTTPLGIRPSRDTMIVGHVGVARKQDWTNFVDVRVWVPWRQRKHGQQRANVHEQVQSQDTCCTGLVGSMWSKDNK